MIKHALATVVGAAAVVGAASPAMAIGNDEGTRSVNGNGSTERMGDHGTHGNHSPQNQLIQGSLNKLCLGIPVEANLGSLVGILVPITAQDINVLASPQDQQCARNSAQQKGDEPLSHILNDISALSGNGVSNR
ncbi:rodlin [Streptomyces daliensis]|uniref:RdlA protein n=1 Tax=Streptomyces daliensis TaxID=299421 RepID=A0A8T4IL90_9ACTN|nr:RdlA protein [Streptomyces daliensis]